MFLLVLHVESGKVCWNPFWDERMRSMMQGKHVVAALWAMLLVCAICCVPVVSLELFVSDDGVDEVGSTHVQTIPFALNQDGTEVDVTLGPTSYSPVAELVACGAKGAPFDERVCRCPEGTYHDGDGECVACEYTDETNEACEQLGQVVVVCEVGSMSDQSACTNCTAVGMFVSEDGALCVGSCAAGEVVVAEGTRRDGVCGMPTGYIWEWSRVCGVCAYRCDMQRCRGCGWSLWYGGGE